MPVIEWKGDASSAVRAQDALTESVRKFKEGVSDATIKEKDLDRAAQRIAENANPQERYNRKMRELGELVGKSKLSMDNALLAAQKYGRELDRAGTAGRSAFGSEQLSSMASMAASYISIGAAVAAVTSSLREMEAEAQKSADSVFDALGSAGELQQISKNPAEFQANVAEARSLVRRGIVKPEEKGKSFDIVFDMLNAEFNRGERETLYRAAQERQIKDVSQTGGRVRTVQDIFGKTDTGDVTQTMDKAFAIANHTLDNVDKTLEQIPNFASEARNLGIDYEHAGAAYVAIRKQSPNAEVAATREQAFLSAVDAKQLWKGSLEATVADIKRQTDAGATAKSILGNTRAIRGFRNLASSEGQAIYNQVLPEIEGAEGVSARQRFLGTDPRLRAAKLRAEAEGRKAQTIEDLNAERESLLEAVRAEEDAGMAAQGERFYDRWLRKAAFSLGDVAGTDNLLLAGAARYGRANPEGLISPETLAAIEDYLRRIATAAEATKEQQQGRAAARPE